MMQSTGIVRKVDELGRVVLPKELRDTLDMPEKTPLQIFTNGGDIILRKYAPGCTFCGSMDELSTLGDKPVCGGCVSKIKTL